MGRTGYKAVDAKASGCGSALVIRAVYTCTILIVGHIVKGHLLSIHWLVSGAQLNILSVPNELSGYRGHIHCSIVDTGVLMTHRTAFMNGSPREESLSVLCAGFVHKVYSPNDTVMQQCGKQQTCLSFAHTL